MGSLNSKYTYTYVLNQVANEMNWCLGMTISAQGWQKYKVIKISENTEGKLHGTLLHTISH